MFTARITAAIPTVLATALGAVGLAVATAGGAAASTVDDVVTGVDATHGIVHLNDSGTSDGRDEQIPLQLFVQSWETSNELMVVTL